MSLRWREEEEEEAAGRDSSPPPSLVDTSSSSPPASCLPLPRRRPSRKASHSRVTLWAPKSIPSFSKRWRRVTVVAVAAAPAVAVAAAVGPLSAPPPSAVVSPMTPDHAPEIPSGAPGSLALASGTSRELNMAQGVQVGPDTTTKKSVAGGGGGRNGERRWRRRRFFSSSFLFFPVCPPPPPPPFSSLVARPIPNAEKNARLAAWTPSFSK